MSLKTAEQYVASLRDGRELYMNGRRIEDVTTAPEFEVPLRTASRDYEYEARGEIATYTNENGEIENRLFQVPMNEEQLNQRIEMLRDVSIISGTSGALFALLNVKDVIESVNAGYAANIVTFFNHCRENDLRLAEVITDAKGDRSRHPLAQDDPDLYLHIVERRDDGVVVRGAKLHITGAAIVHELIVLPTKAMSAGEEDYSVAFAIPVDTPGVKIINRAYAEPGLSEFDYPASAHHSMPEGFVIFDDVFVPNDRLFLCGEYGYAATFAHALGLWERVGGLIAMADRSKLFVGIAQLLAEYNGINKASHIVDKITEIIFYAEMLRMSLECSIRDYETTPSGMLYPNPININVGKYYGASNYHGIVRHLHDLAGGLVLTQPVEADYRNPETAKYIEKYLHTKDGVKVEDRMRLYNLLRDLTADSYGGWELVTTLQAGGGLAAQKIMTYRGYDLESARAAARRAAGIGAKEAAPHAGKPEPNPEPARV